MGDIIQLLPDAIANQIAAGEVIQRPGSAVKELLENSVDAGGTHIKLIVKDAGKTLIQVIDDGCGMSETDARMSLERHATSKIRQAKDLFAIRTMGFRGEAMASIAAISQLEMRSRRQTDELGTRILTEASEVKLQEPCQCAPGTNISVKNLFFNVPARRNFLKSNTVEMRYIIDEFQRVAIAHPDIHFSLHHNSSEVFHLPPTKLRQRLVGIFGPNSNKKLVPVDEQTDIIHLHGFVGKPEFAKKTRGEQFFYVNNRFIKSAYLNHAIMGAYEELLPKDTYPLYVIFLEVDPASIDINVHPTKQEIKFEDERLVYNYLKVAVRHALGQYSITPTLDFERDVNFGSSRAGFADQGQGSAERPATISNIPPFPNKHKASREEWQQLYEGLDAFDQSASPPQETDASPANSLTIESNWSEGNLLDDKTGSSSDEQKEPCQIHGTYIVSQIKSGFLLIDQQAAHERVLYERYLGSLEGQGAISQQELFPKNINLSPADALLLQGMLPEINKLGFDIQEFGKNSFVLHGRPGSLPAGQDEQLIIEQLIELYRQNMELNTNSNENIARSLAVSAAIKRGQPMSPIEMRALIDQLFACSMPFQSPSGRKCFMTYELDDLEKQFGSG